MNAAPATAPGTGPVCLRWTTHRGPLAGLLPELRGGTALLSTPAAYRVAQVTDDGVCITADGPVELADVFEARVFTAERELRWVRRGAGGQGVVLWEEPTGRPTPTDTDTDTDTDQRTSQDGLEPHDVEYLLWGTIAAPAGEPSGWTTLRSENVGTLRIPGSWPGSAGSRLVLTAREYLALDGPYGNAYVFDERLIMIVAGGADGD